MPFVIPIPQYTHMLKTLAAEHGWDCKVGLAMAITGKDDHGDPWSLKHAATDRYNYIWRTAIARNDERVWIQQRAGTLAVLFFSKLRRYRVGPRSFQRRYITAATNAAILEQMLSPVVIDMLMRWPRHLLKGRHLKISLRNNDLCIMTRVHYKADDILKIVRLGTELKRSCTGTHQKMEKQH